MLSLCVAVVVLLSGITLWYRRWLAHHTRRASAESRLVQTARGPVEVEVRGNGKLVMTRRFQNPAYFLIHQAMTHFPRLALRDFVQTETTYTAEEGHRIINRVMADPMQREKVYALADAMVPALPQFDGVMNDLDVQMSLADIPLERIHVPTLIVYSRNDGDVPYENAPFAAQTMPHAELITVEQFGHFIWLGDPAVTADFQQRIETFLGSVRKRC